MISRVFKFHALPNIGKIEVDKLVDGQRLTSHRDPGTLPIAGYHHLKSEGNAP